MGKVSIRDWKKQGKGAFCKGGGGKARAPGRSEEKVAEPRDDKVLVGELSRFSRAGGTDQNEEKPKMENRARWRHHGNEYLNREEGGRFVAMNTPGGGGLVLKAMSKKVLSSTGEVKIIRYVQSHARRKALGVGQGHAVSYAKKGCIKKRVGRQTRSRSR